MYPRTYVQKFVRSKYNAVILFQFLFLKRLVPLKWTLAREAGLKLSNDSDMISQWSSSDETHCLIGEGEGPNSHILYTDVV